MRKNTKFMCVIALVIGKLVCGAAEAPRIGQIQFAAVANEQPTQVIERAKRFGYSFKSKNPFKPNELVLVWRGNNTFTVGRIVALQKSGKYKIEVDAAENLVDRIYKDVEAQFIGKFPKNINSQGAQRNDQKCAADSERKLNACPSTTNLHRSISPKGSPAQAKPIVAQQLTKQPEKKQKQESVEQKASVNHTPKAAVPNTAPQHRLQRQQSSRMLFDKNTNVTDKVIIAGQTSIDLSQEVIEKIQQTKSFIKHNLPMNRERINKDLSSVLKRALYYLHGATLELANTRDKGALDLAHKAQAAYNKAKKELDSFLGND